MTACDMRRMVWLNNRPAPEERDKVLMQWTMKPKAYVWSALTLERASVFGSRSLARYVLLLSAPSKSS